MSLMTEGPAWVDRYLQDGWQKQYRRFLLDREERQLLPRFDEFSKMSGPENLDALRRFVGISDAQKATIDHEELGTPLPVGMVRSPLHRFPTPSSVINQLPDGDKKSLVRRLYPEDI